MALKRLFDVCFSFLGLFISLPLWLIFSWALLIEDGWPIFYVQERSGKGGRIFKGIKFRSMIRNAEKDAGPIQAKEDDSRMTKSGRFLRKAAMDELPQLINILKGDMSFVGPRALRPFEIELSVGNSIGEKITAELAFQQRCEVVPGLTGVAQVFAPRDIPRLEKFKYDLWYIKNRNLRMDLRLIILSFMITFLGRWEIRKEKIAGIDIYRQLKNKIDL